MVAGLQCCLVGAVKVRSHSTFIQDKALAILGHLVVVFQISVGLHKDALAEFNRLA